MISTAFKSLRYGKRPVVSFVLLDWSCRESLHTLDYLSQQTVSRDSYEILYIEYYNYRSQKIDEKLSEYASKHTSAPIDLWLIMGMEPNLYYHKHLMYNAGIVHSRGDIIIICDSDAMFPSNFVETVMDTFNNNEDIVLHFDQVRNSREDFYPFNYPSFEDMIGPGVINWRDGKTTGLWDVEDPIHTRNYGACFCAKRSDLIAIGGADEHLDYLGHVCGPYELTFRLVNKGLREVWHDSVFLYHTWHPGSDGVANYIGPSDGRHVSTTALAARETGRVMPLVENAVIRAMREGRAGSEEALIDPSYRELWTEEAISQSANFTLFEHRQAATKLVLSLTRHNVLEYGGQFYGVPHELGPVDLANVEDRALPGIVSGATVEAVHSLLPEDDAPSASADIEPMQHTFGDAGATRVSADIATPMAVATPNGSTGTQPEREIVTESADKLEFNSFLDALQGSSSDVSVSTMATDVLKLTVRNEVGRRLRNQRLADVEVEVRARNKTVDELRAAVSKKDRLITELQRRLTAVEQERVRFGREAALWREHVARFPGSLELLPMLRRTDSAADANGAVSVLPTADPGHFLYGPYIRLDPGKYRLDIRCRAVRGYNGTEPVITVEIAAGAVAITQASFTGRALAEGASVDFAVTQELSKLADPVEFRFSHHGHADFEMTNVRLQVAGALTQPADNRAGLRRQQGFFRPPRMLTALRRVYTSM